MRMRAALAVSLLLLTAGATAVAEEVRSVAVVTQVQGAVFYRTSITLSNGNPTVTTPVEMLFSYRSPADGTFQTTTLALDPGPGPAPGALLRRHHPGVQERGAHPGRRREPGLFGTLLVTFGALDIRAEAGVVARTYSPGPTGGTLGIAYEGRCFCETGSRFRVLTAGRDGDFGSDGSTRANLGIVNEGFGPTDVRITYYDGATGAQLKQFFLSDRHQPRSGGERGLPDQQRLQRPGDPGERARRS